MRLYREPSTPPRLNPLGKETSQPVTPGGSIPGLGTQFFVNLEVRSEQREHTPSDEYPSQVQFPVLQKYDGMLQDP